MGFTFKNLLLVLGLSFAVGGIYHKSMTFNPRTASVHASSLLLAVAGLVVPAMLVFGSSVGSTAREAVSVFVAIVLMSLYLAARADLLFVSYRDPVAIAQADSSRAYASIEEENRSSARVDLSRDIGDRLRALLRYTFYANELGNNVGKYRRHTLLLSLSFAFEK